MTKENSQPGKYEHDSDFQLRLLRALKEEHIKNEGESFVVSLENAGRMMGISSTTKELKARIRSFIEPLSDILTPDEKTPKGAVISWTYGNGSCDLAPEEDRISVVNRNPKRGQSCKATKYPGPVYGQFPVTQNKTIYKQIYSKID